MLLIDGVKYELWNPPNEDEFEGVVEEHARDIFGEQSVYFGKKKLKSISGVGSIPDGFAFILEDSPQWHIVEVELSSHPLHEHIVSQVSRFISGISSPATQRKLAGAIYDEIIDEDFLKLKVQKVIGQKEIYKFVSDLISKPPVLTIIIEENTPELREAVGTLRYPDTIKFVEFQTFTREDVGLGVHAHLFEPLYKHDEDEGDGDGGGGGRTRVMVKDLIDAGIIKPEQIIYRLYKDRKYEAKILHDGNIMLSNGKVFKSLNDAARSIAGSVDAWTWWRTVRENGKECILDELRKEYKDTLSS